jgi:very-short-patch-repair endonuclease/DNA polymerase III delta prime subunit
MASECRVSSANHSSSCCAERDINMTTLEQRLTQWQQELLDLSNRNRLLNFRPSTSRPSTLQLIAPAAAEVFESLTQGRTLAIVGDDRMDSEPKLAGRSQTGLPSSATGKSAETVPEYQEQALIPQPEVPWQVSYALSDAADMSTSPRLSDAPPEPLRAKVGTAVSSLPSERTNGVAARLLSRARASEQEQGINTLFAAFGLLKWQERPGEDRWAPLVLLPVTLEERARESSFRIAASGDDPEFNQTLVERLRRDFGFALSAEVSDERPLVEVFDEVRTQIAQRSGWDVLEQVHLGIYQFHKLRMFADLGEHKSLASQHDVIQALGMDGVTIAPMPEGVPSVEELDRVVTPQQSFTVLDADASQLRAVQAAIRGSHLVVQGPPGTGKSQTIVNTIAECMAAGRTVLFVSEKAAAIEVVHRRLSERGLGEFCLMLHSHKAHKRDVIYDLGARLNSIADAPASIRENLQLEQLQDARMALNGYAEALHLERQPLGESAYWAHGQLAALHDAPYLAVPAPPVVELTHERLRTWEQAISHVARYAETLREGTDHPWSAIRQQELTFADQEALRHALLTLRTALHAVMPAGQFLAERFKLPMPCSTDDLERLARIAAVIPTGELLDEAWFDPSRLQQIRALVEEAATHARRATELERGLSLNYDQRLTNLNVSEAIATFQRSAFVRFFSPAYRQLRGTLRDLARDGKQRSHADELSSLVATQAFNEHVGWLSSHFQERAGSLGLSIPASQRLSDETWRRLEQRIASVAAILQQLPDGKAATEFIEAICQSGADGAAAAAHAQINAQLAEIERALQTLRLYFEPDNMAVAGILTTRADMQVVDDWLEQHLGRFHDLDNWLRAQGARVDSERMGLAEVTDHLIARDVPPQQWSSSLRRLVLTHWLDQIYRHDRTLLDFRGDDHRARIDAFRQLDRRSIDTGARRIRRILASRQSLVSAAHGGEPALLSFEAQKRKRHMPLRRLFDRIPNLLPTLKPCLMMSPLSVAQFLPADRYRFDVVIFDEASQVRPHDAIGAIMRGKQVIVAGDQKQLPPTTFFDRAVDGDSVDEEQNLTQLESILDGLSAKSMPTTRLLWHYRSRHEDLIAFSNYHIYGRQLVTFPTPTAERAPTRGVRLEYVPHGRYKDEREKVTGTPVRVNREEARRVAELVVRHARMRPEESLGVVALGMTQRDILEEEIERAKSLDRTLDAFFDPKRPDPFFVKPLEHVQGDERDVIVISIGYGKDDRGVLSHNFGPVNQDGGERRLNVLVTRARHQVVVVSSIRSGDIDLSRTNKLGPRLLKNYLDFAERGQVALEAEISGGDGDYESPFEEQVGEALQRIGYTVHRQIGCSRFRIDLAIVHPEQPGRYILGVECDGKTYHQSKTARDRDRLRQELLEGLGWNIHRVWSTDWIRQPDQELNRVISRVEELLSSENSGPVSPSDWASEPTSAAGPDSGSDEASLAASGIQVTHITHSDASSVLSRSQEQVDTLAIPYLIWSDQAPTWYDDILTTSSQHVVDAVVACVQLEGPIHQELLTRRLTAAWGYQRAGSRIAARVEEAIRIAVHHGNVRREGKFLWSSNGSHTPIPRGPSSDGTLREIAHIPTEEILSAMVLLVERAFSLSPDELISRTARIFGFQRTGSEIRLRLELIARLAAKDGELELRDGRYQRPR